MLTATRGGVRCAVREKEGQTEKGRAGGWRKQRWRECKERRRGEKDEGEGKATGGQRKIGCDGETSRTGWGAKEKWG